MRTVVMRKIIENREVLLEEIKNSVPSSPPVFKLSSKEIVDVWSKNFDDKLSAIDNFEKLVKIYGGKK